MSVALVGLWLVLDYGKWNKRAKVIWKDKSKECRNGKLFGNAKRTAKKLLGYKFTWQKSWEIIYVICEPQ